MQKKYFWHMLVYSRIQGPKEHKEGKQQIQTLYFRKVDVVWHKKLVGGIIWATALKD